jgi:multidrug efflux pump subunit AcrB
LTTIAAFAPLMVLPGEAGEFAKSLPLVFIIALTASYVVAMIVTPALASKFFHENIKSKDFLAPIKTFYHDLLDKNLNRPKRTLFYIIIFFLVILWSGQFVNIKMFPNVDKDLIYFNLESEVQGDIKATEDFLEETEAFLSNEPAIQTMTSAIGGGLPRFYMTADIITEGPNKGQILSKIDLSKDNRFDNKDDFVNYLQLAMDQSLIGGHSTVNLLEINMPGPSFEARIISQDYESIIDVSNKLYNKLIDIPGTLDVKNSKPSYNYEYALDIDEDLLSTYGLTKYDVQYQLNLSLNGSDATIMKVEGEEYKINLSSDLDSIDAVKNLSIRSNYTGEKILMKQFATVHLSKKLDSIKHYNREMQISVSSRVLPELSVTDLEAQMKKYIASLDLPEHIKIDYGGESRVITKYLQGLLFAGLVALVAVYIILLIQFNSLKQPLIILATIPLSFIGIIIMLLVTRTPFTFTVGLGIASLFGIVVNNAILLIEYINRGRSLGLTVREACIQSVEKRIRPILLSTITTVFGLIPLVLANSSFFTPMAIALIGGLLFSTVLTLTIIPTIYYLFER